MELFRFKEYFVKINPPIYSSKFNNNSADCKALSNTWLRKNL
jgi:hypothetical protein